MRATIVSPKQDATIEGRIPQGLVGWAVLCLQPHVAKSVQMLSIPRGLWYTQLMLALTSEWEWMEGKPLLDQDHCLLSRPACSLIVPSQVGKLGYLKSDMWDCC